MENKTCREWEISISPLPAVKKIRVYAQKANWTNAICAYFMLSDKETNECNELSKLRNVNSRQEHIEKDIAVTTFTELPPRVYCVAVRRCAQGKYETCYSQANLTTGDLHPTQFDLVDPEPGNQIAYSVLAAVLAFTILGLLAIVHLRRSRSRRVLLPSDDRSEINDDRNSVLSNQKVLLIYSRDCNCHIEAVKAFAEVLEKFLNYQVSYDEKELPLIMTSLDAWIHQVNYSHKIIVISSEGSYLQQQCWLENKDAVANGMGEQDYFLPLLAQLSPMQKHNYRDVLNVRFSYTDMKFTVCDVVSLKLYKIPQDLEVVFTILKDGSPVTWDQDDDVSQEFLRRIEECSQFLSYNPDYIRTSLVRYDSLEATRNQAQMTESSLLHLLLTVESKSDSSQNSPECDRTVEFSSTECLLQKANENCSK